MASTAKWTGYGAADTLITGAAMNSLANAAWLNGALAIDNTTNLNLYMDIELILGSAVTAGSGSAYVSIYKISSANGTTYPTPPGTSSIAAPTGLFVGNIQAVASASFTQGILQGVVIPPGKHMFLIQNNLGVAFPASGNTLLGYRYGEQAV